MHARLRGPNNLLNLHQILKEHDFPCLADEIAEPRPDMSIKVASFTVSEKSLNIFVLISCFMREGALPDGTCYYNNNLYRPWETFLAIDGCNHCKCTFSIYSCTKESCATTSKEKGKCFRIMS